MAFVERLLSDPRILQSAVTFAVDRRVDPDFDFTIPGTGLVSLGVVDDDHALRVLKARLKNADFAKSLQSFLKKNPGVTIDQIKNAKSIKDLTSVQANTAIRALDWFARDVERKTQKAPKFLGGIGDTLLKIAGPAIGFVTGNPALGAAAGVLAGAPGEGFSLNRAALGALQGGLAGAASTGFVGGSSVPANAVPGFSTGVTTPAGGGAIIGSGAAAPLTGLVGGAPLGASPLAVAGGAAALPGVSALPTGGRLPGTNVNVGSLPVRSTPTVRNLTDLPFGGGGSNSAGPRFELGPDFELQVRAGPTGIARSVRVPAGDLEPVLLRRAPSEINVADIETAPVALPALLRTALRARALNRQAREPDKDTPRAVRLA